MGAQPSRPATETHTTTLHEKPPVYSASSQPNALVKHKDGGDGRAMDEALVMDDLQSWNKAFEAVRLVFLCFCHSRGWLHMRTALTDVVVVGSTMRAYDWQ